MGGHSRRLLTSDRALPCDVLYFAGKVPTARAEISMDLAELARCRLTVSSRVSWTAVFLKAYGMVSDECQWLRQSYIRWPVPHVSHHARTVAMVAIQREHTGRPRLCFGRLIDPGHRSLRDIQQQLDGYATKPVPEAFRKQLRLSQMPWPLRRVAWWLTLNGPMRTRERQVGTFSMSSLAGQGVINRDHPTVCTSSVTYGPLDHDGRSLVTLVYDHRLFDGMQAAQTLQQLRDRLQTDVASELRHGIGRAAA